MRYSDRLRIFRENRKIAASGSYEAAGRQVFLPKSAAALAKETVCLFPDAVQAPENGRTEPFRLAEHTVQTDTISAVLQLRAAGVTGEIIALNFANAMAAGGGYRLGGDAQEESLCRCSMLYPAILGNRAFYRPHRLRPTPFYSDRMLISPDVPVIRSSDGSLLSEPVPCTFLTCAAVNRRIAKLLLRSDRRIEAAMRQRIEKIVAAAAERRPAAVVLGAFGCGAFGNKRKAVLPMFEDAVNRLMPDGVQVVFADPHR
ncbi:MAG: TIGR02452 family protein [Oscillospiraceae bacterium]|nr:TIGR02452 family protein [Oscillospiraceae bacterium]